MSAELIAVSNALSDATQCAAAHTVAVHTEARGSSSGVIWRPGLVVTAEHALRRDEEIRLTLPEGTVAEAKLVGRDPSSDLALLRCEQATAAPATFADASQLKPGQLALVVGRTRASGPVATLGVVSLVSKERQLWGGVAISPYVRLDVGLQRINVGGAVVSPSGEIAGIATPRFAPMGALAIPAATVNRVVDVLQAKGHIPRGYLGVGLQPIRLPEAIRGTLPQHQRTAVIVLEVEQGGPADTAGVVIGDILLAVEGKPMMRLEDVHAHLHGQNIDATLNATVLRGGERREIKIKVAERPNGGRAR
jgi:S1-C subfamily serine protease